MEDKDQNAVRRFLPLERSHDINVVEGDFIWNGKLVYYNKSRIFGEFIIFAYGLSNDNFLVSNNFRNSCKYTCGWLQFALLIQYLLSYLQLQLYFKYICGKSLD